MKVLMKSVNILVYKQRRNGWHAAAVYKVAGLMARTRLVLGLICLAVLLVTAFWSQCGDLPQRPISAVLSRLESAAGNIECRVNGKYSVPCRRERDDVLVPFSFLHKYFEVYGKTINVDGVERFEWSHSYGKVYHPKKKYDPHGTFTTFENYNVEVRDRVKCISGIDGVPVSIQWDPKGFYYPTQIAQYGLAHYSKNLTEAPPRRRIIDDSEKVLENWIVSKDAYLVREYDEGVKSNVLRFLTAEHTSSQVWCKVNISQDFVLSVDLVLKPNSSLTVVLQNKDKKETIYLHYVTNTQLIYAQEEHIYYGIGAESRWRRLTRDLIIDAQKGWALQDKPKRKQPRNKFKISSIILIGSGSIDNVTIATSEHIAAFLSAARWLRGAQRPDGGWPVPARRRLAQGLELKPGWHSAMSQGHGMSLLSRAYLVTGEAGYLSAARRALRPLDRPPSQGGVRALWMDRYVWYEEYPTTPPLFVLNGFIYTLLGLYDLHMIEGDNSISLAKKMFDDGMTSLKKLLPLFDTGSGSFYDLRHFTLGVSPNIARWDYHATHVNQLYLLAGIDDDPILINTAKRWEGYMQGNRAAHN